VSQQPLPLQKAICKLLIPFAPTQQLSGPHDARYAFRTLVTARYRALLFLVTYRTFAIVSSQEVEGFSKVVEDRIGQLEKS